MIGEADYDMTASALGGNARYAQDDQLLVRFYQRTEPDVAETEKQGRPIYKEVDFIEIHQPGNKDSVIDRKAYPVDIERFARHYEAYKARTKGDGVHIEGTPLVEWPGITRSQAEELKFFNVYSVEQLAGMSDSNAQNIMGIQSLKAAAKLWLEKASDKQLQEAQDEIAQLKAQMAELMAAKEEKPKRGRPRKTEAPVED
jgi:hypothetical protein